MNRRFPTSAIAVAGLLIVAGAAAAHHGSSAAYDLEAPVRLTGTVTGFVWANPHTRVFVDVAGQSNVVNWGIELRPAPAGLTRMGWTRHMFQPGDMITITVSPSRFGTPTGVAETNHPILKNGARVPGTGSREGA